MMGRVVILGLVVTSLLLASAALAVQGVPEPDPLYRVEGCAVSGGEYRMVTLVWEVEGAVGGGDYWLAAPEAPGASGSGCCCTYAPVVFKSYGP